MSDTKLRRRKKQKAVEEVAEQPQREKEAARDTLESESPPPADTKPSGFDHWSLKAIRCLLKGGLAVVQFVCMLYFLWRAYSIRLFAVKGYGRVIHEFDPWFNFRATQYLADNGLSKFFHWYDYMSWYPIGRPVGTTIYPGMQIISVAIWEAMKYIPEFGFRLKKRMPLEVLSLSTNVTVPGEFRGKYEFGPMSLNDVCVFVPAWFGALGSLILGLLAAEATGSRTVGVAACGVMAVIPAHFSRGIAGGFDNESVAVTALCMTFWLWVRSLRTPTSWVWAPLAGLAYVYMAAAWGGYIFVINMVAAHAAMMVALGRYGKNLYRAYTLFFIVGTAGAVQVPVIGWQPFKSMEQVGALLVFAVFQVLGVCDYIRSKRPMTGPQFFAFRTAVFGLIFAVLVAAVQTLFAQGYFSPLGARIRGLFIQHRKTGNPLVDSVAEHQAASNSAYYYYLHNVCYIAPVGLLLCLFNRTPGKLFLVLYAVIAYYFSLKMARLIIICGPIASALAGVAIGGFVDLCTSQVIGVFDYRGPQDDGEKEPLRSGGISSMWRGVGWVLCAVTAPARPVLTLLGKVWRFPLTKLVRAAAGIGLLALAMYGDTKGPHLEWLTTARSYVPQRIDTISIPERVKLPFPRYFGKQVELPVLGNTKVPSHLDIPFHGKYKVGGVRAPSIRASDPWWPKRALKDFVGHCEHMAEGMSSPQIMFKTQRGDIIDDYREAYFWLRDKTPEDARVMAWWDYGYQITGIGNRTTIADGNTWNHEHIATLGKCLTSPEDKAHSMIRHLADYVLVWGGGRGDDLAKSIHMARIGTSIYSDICPGDPKCTRFGFMQGGEPTPMMAKSLLYKLHSHGQKGVRANTKLWREAYQSKHGLVRIFQVLNVDQTSKEWVANPDNRVCDAPGSWYCVGQYPPKLRKHFKNRKNFAQLEDFNRQQEQNAYSKAVLENDAD